VCYRVRELFCGAVKPAGMQGLPCCWAIAENGTAYRIGGDEVLILLPNTHLGQGAGVLRAILRELANHRVSGRPLSAVAGLASATAPSEQPSAVKARADAVQYRAKERSKSRPPSRFGALVVDGEETIEEFEPTALMHFSETEQLALKQIDNCVDRLFTLVIWGLSLSRVDLHLPMTPEEEAALTNQWQAAVAERRWERIDIPERLGPMEVESRLVE
jgi:hypothetical protein